MGSSLSSREGLELVSVKNDSAKDVRIQFIHPYKSCHDSLLVEAGSEKSVETSEGSFGFVDEEGKSYFPYERGEIMPKITVDGVTFFITTSRRGVEIHSVDT